MKRIFLALCALGLAQNGYCGWQDALKEVAKQVVDQSLQAQTQPQTQTQSQQPQVEVESGSDEDVRRQLEQADRQEQQMLERQYPLPFKVNVEGPLMKQGLWRDSRTGLVWARCFVGRQWNGSSCDGDAISASAKNHYYRDIWADAFIITENWSFGGHDDWRIPTVEEVVGLMHCSGSKLGWKQDTNHMQEFPADSGTTKKVYTRCNEYYPNLGTPELFPGKDNIATLITSNSNPEKAWLVLSGNSIRAMDGGEFEQYPVYMLAVREGKTPSYYPGRLSDALSLKAKKAAAESAELAKKQAKEKADQAAKNLAQEERKKKIALLSQRNGKQDIEITIGTNQYHGTLVFDIQAIADRVAIWAVTINRGNCALPVGTSSEINRTVQLKFGQNYRGYSNNCKMQNIREIEVVTENGKFLFNF